MKAEEIRGAHPESQVHDLLAQYSIKLLLDETDSQAVIYDTLWRLIEAYSKLSSPQHPTPTLTDEMIEDWSEDRKEHPYYGSCDQEYREGLVIGAKYARDFMQSGEAPQESKGDGIDLVKTLEDVLNQIKSLTTYSRKQTGGSGRKYFYDASQVDQIIYNYLSTRQGEDNQPLSN